MIIDYFFANIVKIPIFPKKSKILIGNMLWDAIVR